MQRSRNGGGGGAGNIGVSKVLLPVKMDTHSSHSWDQFSSSYTNFNFRNFYCAYTHKKKPGICACMCTSPKKFAPPPQYQTFSCSTDYCRHWFDKHPPECMLPGADRGGGWTGWLATLSWIYNCAKNCSWIGIEAVKE